MLSRMNRSRSRRRSAIGLSLLSLLTGAVLATGSPAGVMSPAPAEAASRWIRDYNYDFTGPQDDSKWGRYGWGHQPVGHGAMGVYKPDNVYTHDGVLALRTIYRDGQWSSAGVSGNPSFSAVGGKWEVRAKMPVAKGIGYAFLLMPTDGTWPPEVNIAEGRVNGRVEHFYHWGTPENHQRGMTVSYTNTHEWHTYGVILEGDTITYTIDGDHVVGQITNVPVTNKRLWLGFQTGAMDPNGDARAYETIDGGVPNSSTPASSEIQIDWVAHYHD
jgi:beta-glucanase (GH16 family)